MNKEAFMMQVNLGNEYWHTDSTYHPVSSKVAMLNARALPPSGGGNTEFADMRAAYDVLSADTKERIEALCAYHSTTYSQGNDLAHFPSGSDHPVAEYLFHQEAYLRPLVKIHPVTQRKSLFAGRHAFGIPGFSRAASRQLLTELLTDACQDDRVYSHNWCVGDLVIWDNRCMMHRARPYDYTEHREMLGTRIAGDPLTEGFLEDRTEAKVGREVLAVEMALLRGEREGKGGGSTSTKRSAL
jgi:alpha-ketoglutarate-dependent taurine dioxygenase